MEFVGTLMSVEGRQTAKGVVYEADCGGKTFSTWKEDVAAKARQFIGQSVKIEYASRTSTGRNGQVYENNTLFDIAGQGGQLIPDASRENATQQVQATPAGPVVVSNPMPQDREARIVRQSAMKTAFGFYGSLYAGAAGNVNADDVAERAYLLAAEIYKLAWGGKADAEKVLKEAPKVEENPDDDLPF